MAIKYHQELHGSLGHEYRDVFQRIRPASRILEFGCSTGFFSSYMQQRGHNVLGVELDPDASSRAREAGVTVLTGDVEDDAFRRQITGAFDYILLMNVLEHLREPRVILEYIRSCLDDNGRIIVSGPNVACWTIRRDLLLGRWNYTERGIMDRTHLRFFTQQTWRDLIMKSGYEITFSTPSYFVEIPAARYIQAIIRQRLFSRLQSSLYRLFPNLFAVVFTFEAKRAVTNGA